MKMDLIIEHGDFPACHVIVFRDLSPKVEGWKKKHDQKTVGHLWKIFEAWPCKAYRHPNHPFRRLLGAPSVDG